MAAKFFIFQSPLMSVTVAGAAAQDWATTHHSSSPFPTCPSSSIQDPQWT